MKKTTRRKNIKGTERFSLDITVSIFVFFILLVSLALTIGVVYLLDYIGVIKNFGELPQVRLLILFLAVSSIVVGYGISLLTMKFPLKPVKTLIIQMNRLASGDFRTRLQFSKLISKHPIFAEITESFNTMATELESTEMLRNDFINNFSHEFKTPIVSIAGFAKLLKKGNLTEEQKLEYINIIETESMRLADMATNVLNLTKVENQTILTDVSEFNLSEQIRSCVLLLENKWTEKNVELNLEFDEYMIRANEEMLKQVWINLIDNAIKFTSMEGYVEVAISENADMLNVSVINTGSEIPPDKQKKIFNKFYQADESHNSAGNGIGLAVASRVVKLHKGDITVESENNTTSFTVSLPVTQV